MANLDLIHDAEINALVAAQADPRLTCRCLALVEYLRTSPDRASALEFLRDALDDSADAAVLEFLSTICPGGKEILDADPVLIESNPQPHN